MADIEKLLSEKDKWDIDFNALKFLFEENNVQQPNQTTKQLIKACNIEGGAMRFGITPWVIDMAFKEASSDLTLRGEGAG
jgi:hypothetical protein